jgi:hypothetical protein
VVSCQQTSEGLPRPHLQLIVVSAGHTPPREGEDDDGLASGRVERRRCREGAPLRLGPSGRLARLGCALRGVGRGNDLRRDEEAGDDNDRCEKPVRARRKLMKTLLTEDLERTTSPPGT